MRPSGAAGAPRRGGCPPARRRTSSARRSPGPPATASGTTAPCRYTRSSYTRPEAAPSAGAAPIPAATLRTRRGWHRRPCLNRPRRGRRVTVSPGRSGPSRTSVLGRWRHGGGPVSRRPSPGPGTARVAPLAACGPRPGSSTRWGGTAPPPPSPPGCRRPPPVHPDGRECVSPWAPPVTPPGDFAHGRTPLSPPCHRKPPRPLRLFRTTSPRDAQTKRLRFLSETWVSYAPNEPGDSGRNRSATGGDGRLPRPPRAVRSHRCAMGRVRRPANPGSL